ncbi:MAG: hypothetical protein HN475_02960 [Piscirickettsiaceae bacterium]|mgnify:CR=1 FL=1|jgi:hypothetical protein|nr:hypothetical protein [Piscirickettsiaceae bacterium]
MTDLSDLSKIILPFIQQYHGQRLLLAGELAKKTLSKVQDTRSHTLTTPFSLAQLNTLPPIDIAIISDVIENLTKVDATQWLATLRNQYAQHLLLIVDQQRAEPSWQLTDYLALGFKKRGELNGQLLFSYAIEDYQFKRDWLNSRHWANPENFDKYRW